MSGEEFNVGTLRAANHRGVVRVFHGGDGSAMLTLGEAMAFAHKLALLVKHLKGPAPIPDELTAANRPDWVASEAYADSPTVLAAVRRLIAQLLTRDDLATQADQMRAALTAVEAIKPPAAAPALEDWETEPPPDDPAPDAALAELDADPLS